MEEEVSQQVRNTQSALNMGYQYVLIIAIIITCCITCCRLKRLNLSGCRAVTSYGIEKLLIHQPCLEELDLSGVYKIDGETLTTYVEDCPRLVPQKLAYCNDIEDGPWPDLASGCQNLECPTRFCCQKLRN